jgi:quercetin dioxygenase-like cupin family protein
VTRVDSLPKFLREALDENDDDELDLARLYRHAAELERLLPLLSPLLPKTVSDPLPAGPEAGARRLLARVSELPLRYAPFYTDLAELWDLSEADVVAVLERAADASAWRKPGLPGVGLLDVTGGPRVTGARLQLARFAPGMRYPAHRHLGREALFVLEGWYRDRTGRVVGPGDLHEMAPDTEHHFNVGPNEPCVAASLNFGFEFTGLVMRLLVRLFG